MTTYQVTLAINSTEPTARVRDLIDNMVTDWFGSDGEVTNLLIEDPEADPDRYYDDDFRTCDQQATDDHNEGVARLAGARTYTRTDGTTWTNPELEED